MRHCVHEPRGMRKQHNSLRFVRGGRGVRGRDVPRRGYSRDVDQVVVHTCVLDALAVRHVHPCTTPDEAELRPLDPWGRGISTRTMLMTTINTYMWRWCSGLPRGKGCLPAAGRPAAYTGTTTTPRTASRTHRVLVLGQTVPSGRPCDSVWGAKLGSLEWSNNSCIRTSIRA